MKLRTTKGKDFLLSAGLASDNEIKGSLQDAGGPKPEATVSPGGACRLYSPASESFTRRPLQCFRQSYLQPDQP